MHTIFLEIRDILKEEVQAARGIKSVYIGDPGIINKSNLPALTIYPTSSSLEGLGCGPGGTDLVRHEVNIGLIWDLRDAFDKNPDEVTIVKELMECIFERDSNGALQDDTIVGAIRKNITLASEVNFNDNFDIDYGVTDVREFPTLEATVMFNVELRPKRPV